MTELIHDSSGVSLPEGSPPDTDRPGDPMPGPAMPAPPGTPAPPTGIPEGDPLADYRDVFAEDPQLLKTFTQHFGNEHTVGQVLQEAHTFADQALNPGEKDAIKRLGLANDPIFLGALGRLGREYAGMRQTISEQQRTIARLQAQVQGKPVMHTLAENDRVVLGGRDLHAEEMRLSRAYQASSDPAERAQLQRELSAVQRTLYRK